MHCCFVHRIKTGKISHGPAYAKLPNALNVLSTTKHIQLLYESPKLNSNVTDVIFNQYTKLRLLVVTFVVVSERNAASFPNYTIGYSYNLMLKAIVAQTLHFHVNIIFTLLVHLTNKLTPYRIIILITVNPKHAPKDNHIMRK